MDRGNKINKVLVSAVMLLSILLLNVTAVYAWFNGQGYIGKTMSYSRTMYIGADDASITNYHGYLDEEDEFIYTEINPLVGFERNDLIPSSYIYLKSEIENVSVQDDIFVSLYLQNVVYGAPLNPYIYFGTTNPDISRETYKNDAVYNETSEEYTIGSVPLIIDTTIAPGETIEVRWYIYIDSDAGMEVATAAINLGKVAIVYN